MLALVTRWALTVAVVGQAAVASAGIAVSAGGQATYTIPLNQPPGIAGMTPNLSLQYVDGGINGPVGAGWSVQGISTITRCPSTRPLDGVSRLVYFDAADRLCLDGQRLIRTNASGERWTPVPGDPGDATGLLNAGGFNEFRTEKDMFARIRAYGTSTPQSANSGPAYFKVWTKAGQIFEYGPLGNDDPNSRVVPSGREQPSVWAVSRISDVAGNYIDFKYAKREVAWGSGSTEATSTGLEWDIAEIRYTGRAGQLPTNKVTFDYEDRASTPAPGHDRSEAYQLDRKNLMIHRLRAVRMYVNSLNNAILVREYRLSYELSPVTGRSRVTSIAECAGPLPDDPICLPPTRFTYSNGVGSNLAFVPNSQFTQGALRTTTMLDRYGEYGILVGDFNGDGRADIIRWSSNTGMTQLLLSNGDGTFAPSASFNLGSRRLSGNSPGTNDACYRAVVADFNGDGYADILRVAKSSCSTDGGNVLFLSQGNGAFSEVSIPASIDLEDVKQVITTVDAPCVQPQAPNLGGGAQIAGPTPSVDMFGPWAGSSGTTGTSSKGPQVDSTTLIGGLCTQTTKTRGKRVYILDLNGDGILDIVTTIAVEDQWNSGARRTGVNEDELCAGLGSPAYSGACTRVFAGSSAGAFTEQTTNVANRSLYSDPPDIHSKKNPYRKLPDQADLDGDGLQDILARYTGRWRSNGDFNFTESPAHLDLSQYCGLPIDFNGDGRSDCLVPDAISTSQTLTLSYGAAASAALPQFNLTGPSDNLYATDRATSAQTVGVVVDDFDGDGRQDILRWSTTASDAGIYLANGDGSFRSRIGAGLTTLGKPLQSLDGSSSFSMGDFLGIGSNQILLMVFDPASSATGNQLLQRESTPVDVMVTATSPTGLVSRVDGRASLSGTAGRYIKEGPSPTGGSNLVDLQLPIYAVTSVANDTGNGSALSTEYLYKGLKAERGGRGLLGFREVRQQSKAPDGAWITVVSENLQSHPYTGVTARSTTYLASLTQVPGQVLSRTTNIYCDKKAAAGASASATADSPCPLAQGVSVSNPFLLRSVEEGADLVGQALPTITTTNTFNDYGDALQIVVDTQLGTSYSARKTTVNVFCDPGTLLSDGSVCPNNINGDNWILGRLSRSSVTNSVSSTALTASAGTAPLATATTGTGALQALAVVQPGALTFAPATTGTQSPAQTVTVSNTGTAALTIGALTFSPATDFVVVSNGCTAAVAAGGNCTVQVAFKPGTAGAKTATLSIANNGSSGAQSVSLSGTGQVGASLSAMAFGNVAVGATSQLSATLSNPGTTALTVTVPTATSVSGTDFSFVSTTCTASVAAGGSCTVTVKFAPTAKVPRSGTLTVATGAGNLQAALSGTGTQGTAAVSPATLAFAATNVGATSAAQTVTVSNTGTAALTVSALTFNPATDFVVVSNGCTAAVAAGGSCAVQVAFKPASAGTKSASLSIANNGSSGAQTVSLSGTGQIGASISAVAFGNVVVGTTSQLNATLSNPGTTALTVTVPTAASVVGTDFSFVSTTCTASVAAGGSCTVTVKFAPTAKVPRSGTLTVATGAGNLQAALSGTGTQGTAAVSPATLAFAATNVGATSAAQTVTVSNTGTAALTVSALTFNPATDFVVVSNGCTAAVAAGGSCTVQVAFKPASAGAKTASLSIANNGSSGARSVSLSGTGQVGASLSAVAFGNVAVGATSQLSATLSNPGTTALTVTVPTATSVSGTDFSFVSTTCTASVAAGGSCTVTVKFAPTAKIARTGTLTVATGAGNLSAALSGTGTQGTAAVSPATLAFAATNVGATSAAQTVTVSNTGTAALTIGALTFSPATDFVVVSNGCTAAVAAGGNCTVQVAFKPGTAGAKTATLSIANNGSSGAQSVSLSGAVPNAPTLTPSPLNFGNVAINGSSQMTATLTNPNPALAVLVTVPTASSVSGTDFSFVSTTCGSTLAAAASCTITVKFTATTLGARTGTLSVANSVGTATVGLTGSAVQGNAGIAPVAITFSATQTGSASSAQTVTVTNTGTDVLSVGAPTVSGEFSVSSNTCASLAVNASCAIGVTFAPTATGVRSGTLTLPNNGTSGSKTVALSGTGQAPSASASPSLIGFGNIAVGAVGQQAVSITNTGVGPLTLGATSFSSTAFSIVAGNCGTTLAAGATCQATIQFAPTSNIAYSGTASVPTNAGTLSVNLSGTGTQGVASLSTTSLVFGSTQVSSTATSQTVTVNNSGNGTLVIGSPTTSAEFTVSSNNCSSLAPAASCVIGVGFTPAAIGTRSGTLTLTNNGQGGTKTVSLSGVGIQGNASTSVSALTFPATQTGSTAASQTVVITNVGTSPLTMSAPSVSGDFSIAGNGCTAAIAVNATCSISIAFAPTLAGSRAGTLTLPNNGSTGTRSVSLSGTGQLPSGSITPNQLAFGNVMVGLATTRVGTLTNTGVGPLTIGTATVSPAVYSLVAGNCPATLAAGGSCQTTVQFTPTGPGLLNGSVSVPTNAGTLSVSLSGTGLQGNAVASTSAMSFLPTQVGSTSAPLTVVLTNQGTAAMTINSPSVTSPFALSANTCSTLAVGGSCSLSVTFNPGAAGSATGTLQIPNNGSSGTKVVSLSGSGQLPSGVLSPSALNFADAEVYTLAQADALLYNTGVGPLTITSAQVTGIGFSLINSNCGAGPAPGTSCFGTIQFAPTSQTTYTGSLVVSTNAGTFTTSLSGRGAIYAGAAPSVGATPARGSFLAVVAAAYASRTSTLTLMNQGDLTITSLSVSCSAAGAAVTTPPAVTLPPGGRTQLVVSHPDGGFCNPVITAANAANSPLTIRGY